MSQLPESLRKLLDAKKKKPEPPKEDPNLETTTIWRDGTIIKERKQ